MAGYIELVFRSRAMEGQRIWPDDARKILAKALDGVEVSPALFHRDETGTIQGRIGDDRNGEGMGLPPSVIFDGGTGFLRIYGVGHGQDTLDRSLSMILSALNRHFGQPVMVEMKEGDLGMKYTGHNILHSIRRLVISKKPVPTTGDYSEIVRKEIVRGLVSFSRIHAPDLEGTIPGESEIDFLEGVPVPVEIKPGILASAIKNVVVAFPVRLSGPWTVGRLRSRGYGLIRPINPTGMRSEAS